MKASFSLAAIVGLSVANAEYFSLLAARSASPIHLRTIEANGEHLWIGKPSGQYCPDQIQKQGGCPNTNETNFAGGDDTLSMGTLVPGGQLVFIDPASGAIGFTQAHSMRMPEGAIVTGWSKEHTDHGYDILSWKDGLLACPTIGDEGPYQIYAAGLPNVDYSSNCLGFEALAEGSQGSKPDAWQYT